MTQVVKLLAEDIGLHRCSGQVAHRSRRLRTGISELARFRVEEPSSRHHRQHHRRCRIGTKRMLVIPIDICDGRGTVEDIEILEDLAYSIKDSALCGLGQTAPNPVLTTLKYFKDEYLAHIECGRCPAKVCKALIQYRILPDKCTGCGACLKICPTAAITGEKKEVHFIHQEKCIKCGMCYSTCRFEEIKVNWRIR